MKIILTAFNKLVSEPMDVPENTTPYFDLVLTQPLQAISGYDGKTILENPEFGTRCRFEWIGKYTLNSEKIYVLTDIIKM